MSDPFADLPKGHCMTREDTRKRDDRIIQLLGYGLKPAQIAERLGISPRVVTDAKYRNAQGGVRRGDGYKIIRDAERLRNK